tara:strand:- start:43 stop:258 length:216 start_codon:yes stop_codon:yes gene_type:complete
MFSDEINLFEAYVKDSNNNVIKNNKYQDFKVNLEKLFDNILADNISKEQLVNQISFLKEQLNNYEKMLNYQ